MKKALTFLSALVVVGSFIAIAVSTNVFAARNVQTVELKATPDTEYTDVTEGGYINTNPGETIDVKIVTNLTDGSQWRSTGVRIAGDGPGSTFHCISGSDHPAFTTNGPHTLEYTIPKDVIPPAGPATRNLYVKLFSGNTCNTNGGWSSSERQVYEGVIEQGPIAVDDYFNVHTNATLNGDVLANDYVNASIDNEPITTANLVDDVDEGSLEWHGDGTFTYTPGNFVGQTTFTYNVPFIGLGVDPNKISDTATVTITVTEHVHVVSFTNPVTGQEAALEVEDEACAIDNASVSSASNNSVQDPGFEYPVGLMNFTLDCASEIGITVTVVQYYYEFSESNLVARKYNSVTNTYQSIPGATIEQTTVDGQVVTKLTYQITDGGELDEDGVANGVIVDPSGVATLLVDAPATGLGGQASITNVITALIGNR